MFTFVPQEPGLYRFALVVASGGMISEPDLVDVTVLATPPAATSALPPTPSTEDLARSGLASSPGGAAAATALIDAFEAAATRLDLYASYADFHAELSRRLEKIVPQDAAQRGLWVQRLLNPLTVRLIEELRIEGLDLLNPLAQDVPLTDAQKRRLAGQLRSIAAGCRKLQSKQ
jgi:hypothetical protein